jgi:hypothetical protein
VQQASLWRQRRSGYGPDTIVDAATEARWSLSAASDTAVGAGDPTNAPWSCGASSCRRLEMDRLNLHRNTLVRAPNQRRHSIQGRLKKLTLVDVGLVCSVVLSSQSIMNNDSPAPSFHSHPGLVASCYFCCTSLRLALAFVSPFQSLHYYPSSPRSLVKARTK